MSSAERLYTPELLALTLRLADHPWVEGFPLEGSARSRSCGSTLSLGIRLGDDARISQLGMRVHACAVGQAAAAIFAGAAQGRSQAEIERALAAMSSWVAGEGDVPDWPGIEAIAAAAAYPARHGAMLLPWQAAQAALCSDAPND